jgi:hypothetical protein
LRLLTSRSWEGIEIDPGDAGREQDDDGNDENAVGPETA